MNFKFQPVAESPKTLFRSSVSEDKYASELDRLKKKSKKDITCIIIDRENTKLPDISKHIFGCKSGVSASMFYACIRKKYELSSNNALIMMIREEDGNYGMLNMTQTIGQLPKNEHGFVDILYCEEHAFG